MEASGTHGKRPALGKGIESLLGPRPQPAAVAPVAISAVAATEATGKPLEIALDRIERNPHQTRTTFDEEKLAELAKSIAASGVVQPIVVKELADGRYQLIMGERRWRASQAAGKTTIPAFVRAVSDEQALEMTIVENLQREDLNPMEQARAFERLSREFKLTQEEMAVRTGKNRTSIVNYIRLLKLPDGIQNIVEEGALSFGHARALLALESPERIYTASNQILGQNLSVRQAEKLIQAMINPEPRPEKIAKPAQPPQDANVHEAQEMLQRRLGLKVRIEDKSGKGRVIIEYARLEDFDAILEALGE